MASENGQLKAEIGKNYNYILENKDKNLTVPYFLACARLAYAYELLQDFENAKKWANNGIKLYEYGDNFLLRQLLASKDTKQLAVFDKNACNCYDILARQGDFDAFNVALEWNQDIKKRFYYYTRETLKKLGVIQSLQDLHNGKINPLIIEAPPSIGKSVMGDRFSVFRSGMALLKDVLPRILFGNGDAALTKGFYNDTLNYLGSNEYRFKEIFKYNKEIITDAEAYQLWFEYKQREPNFLFRSREQGATGKIHINEEGLLYIDDFVLTPAEARNKATLSNIYAMLASTFLDRTESENVPALFIGTPWDSDDVLNTIIKNNKNNPKLKVLSLPCYYINKNGEKVTNFDYKGKFYKSVAYFDKQISEENDKVIANAKFLMKMMDREGRPFENLNYFDEDELNYALQTETPYRTSATDVAVKQGGDYFSNGYFYVFDSLKEIFVVDAIHSNNGTDYTIPLCIKKHIQHQIERSEFEEKEGTVTSTVNYGIAEKVKQGILKDKKIKCNLKSHNAAGLKSKGNRIDTYENEIKGIRTKTLSEDMKTMTEGYVYRFWSPESKFYKSNPEYALAIEHLKDYSTDIKKQGKQKDDFPDMLSMNMAYCIDMPKKPKNVIKQVSAKKFGL